MVAICFFLLSFFGANLVAAVDINFGELIPIADSVVADAILNNVNVAANFKGVETTTWDKTIRLVIPNVENFQKSLNNIVTATNTLATGLKQVNTYESSSQIINIPKSVITDSIKALKTVNNALETIVKARISSNYANSPGLLKVINGSIIVPKSETQDMLNILQLVSNSFETVKTGLAAFENDLLQLAIAALKNSDNYYASYIFKQAVNTIAAASKNYAAAAGYLELAHSQTTKLYKANTNGQTVAIPAGKFLAITNTLFNNLANAFNNNANGLVLLYDKLDSSL